MQNLVKIIVIAMLLMIPLANANFGYNKIADNGVTISTTTGNLTNLTDLVDFSVWNVTWDQSWLEILGYNHTADVFTLWNTTWDQSYLTASTGNASWNESYADTLYPDIGFNFSQETFDMWNSTWDNSYLTQVVDTNASNCGDGEYLDGDGACINFNTTVTSLLTTTYHNMTSFSSDRGTDEGSLSDAQIYDSISLNITEESGANGLDLRFNATGITDFNQLLFRYRTDLGENHNLKVQIYDYSDSDWEDYGLISESTGFIWFSYPVLDADEHISGGIVQIRFLLESNGNTGHTHYFDYVVITEGVATPSSSETDPFSWHRDTRIEIGNFSTTGNVTADYYFGNGSQLTDIFNYTADVFTLWNSTWDQDFIDEDFIEAQIFDDDNTANLNISGYNVTDVDCFYFLSGGSWCSA